MKTQFGFDISRSAVAGDYLITVSHSAVIICYLKFKRTEFYFITFIRLLLDTGAIRFVIFNTHSNIITAL